MALSDILEALTLGGAGAVRGYVSAKQEEEARAERERQREEDRKYREAVLGLQQRQFDAAEAARQRQYDRETQRDISEGLLRFTREIPNMAAVRGTISDALKAAEESAGADLFADQGIGMAAKPAAGQTNAAQFLREQEARGKGPSRMQTSMSFLDEVPEFTPSESFRELGTQEFRGVGLRPVTPEERRAIALEEEERKRLLALKEEAEKFALNQERAEQAIADAKARGITDPYALEGIRTQILYGTGVSRPPTADREDRDPFGAELSGMIRTFTQSNQRSPEPAEIADMTLLAALVSNTPIEEAQRRAEAIYGAAGGGGGGGGGSIGGEGATPSAVTLPPGMQPPTRLPELVQVSDFDILRGRTAEEIARAEFDNLSKELESGAITERERINITNRLLELNRIYGF